MLIENCEKKYVIALYIFKDQLTWDNNNIFKAKNHFSEA